MENALEVEIKSHKIKIYDLLMGLFNTKNLDEEIFLNNEIKAETICLSSLFNIKINALNSNPFKNNPFQTKNWQQIYDHQTMISSKQSNLRAGLDQLNISYNQIQAKLNTPIQPKRIDIFFTLKELKNLSQEQSRMFIQCFPDDKVSTLIQKYKEITNDYSPDKKFYFKDLKLNENLSVKDAGLYHNSNIIVSTLKDEEEEKKINEINEKEEYKEEEEEEEEKKEEEEEKEDNLL